MKLLNILDTITLPLSNERDRRDTFRLVLDFVRPLEELVFHFVEEIFERPIEMLDQVLTTSFRLLVTVTRDKPLVVVAFQNSMSGYDVDSPPFLFFLQLEQEHLQYLQYNYAGFQKNTFDKVWGVSPRVNWSKFRIGQYTDDDHRAESSTLEITSV